MSRQLTEGPVDEAAPLLGGAQSKEQPKRWWKTVPFRFSSIPDATLLPILGTITVFLNESEFYIKQPAFLRAIEALSCAEHYAQLNDPTAKLGKHIPEHMCKGEAIQEYVAKLQGACSAIRLGSAVLGTIFILAMFKAGKRRPILILHKLNLVASGLLLITVYHGYPRIPLWCITLAGVTGIVGGGFDLGTSILFASYGDVISDPTRRSSLIFITTSLQYLSQAVCLPISGRLMSLKGNGSTPEVSFYVSIGCAVVTAFMMIFLYPETFVAENQQNKVEADRPGSGNNGVSQANSTLDPRDEDNVRKNASSDKPFHILRENFGLPRVICLLLATFCYIASARMIDWYGILQYPSIKFHWEVSTTTYLVCMQAVIGFINFALVLPTINKLCVQKYKISGRSTAIGIASASAIIAAVSAVFLGIPNATPVVFAIATAIYSLGCGVNSGIQAYTVSVATTSRTSGAALTVISLAATLGKVGSAAMWPTLLSIGLEHSSGQLGGLPFFAAAVLFVVVAISISLADRFGTSKHH